jgi:hypothetical protein
MKPVPFAPVRQQKGEQCEMLTLKGAGDRLQTGLLPTAACLAILENLVTAHKARVFELKLPTGSYGPEHQGRIAEASPGDGDWAGG